MKDTDENSLLPFHLFWWGGVAETKKKKPPMKRPSIE
jgi:hypothetical protein